MARISPEDGMEKFEDEPSSFVPPSAPLPETVPELVRAALSGLLPLSRPLKQWEPEKLSMVHINMVFDRAIGLRPGEIAEKYDTAPERVSVILNHPHAERLLGAIAAKMSERLTDPVERLRLMAHQAIDVKAEILANPKVHASIRDKVASDILDRAGYGARHKIDINAKNTHELILPAAHAERLTNVLEESKRIRDVDFTKFMVSKPQEGATRALSSGAPSEVSAPPSEDGANSLPSLSEAPSEEAA